MRTHGYQPCKADADLWYGPAVRPNDGFKYNYCCILLYVDDCLCMHHDTQTVLTEIQYFMMKSQDQLEYSLTMGFWAWCMVHVTEQIYPGLCGKRCKVLGGQQWRSKIIPKEESARTACPWSKSRFVP